MSAARRLPCSEALDRLGSTFDDELDCDEGASLDRHLQTCDACLATAREIADLHRDLLRLSAHEELKTVDPIPAMLARIHWTAACSRRGRRSVGASTDRPFLWTIVSVAAALLLSLLALDGRPTPRKTSTPEPLPVVELPAPEKPIVAPAPRLQSPPTVDPLPELPRREEPPPSAAEPPRRTPEPAPTVPSTAPTIPESPTAVARLEREGRPARPVAVGETIAGDAPAVVVYPDGTRLFMAAETTITVDGRGKTLSIARGELFADVTPQPRDEALTFVTPGAEVRVVGTWLSVACQPAATLVTVERGRVQVTRKSDRWSIPLREGQYASVEAGRVPTARPLPPNLVADPGFEADGKGWEGIFNRLLGRNFGGVSVTTDGAHSGSRGVQLVTHPAVGYDREVYQDFAVAPGDGVEVAGWLRTAGIGGKGVRLSLLWIGSSAPLGSDLSTTLRTKGLVLREDVAGIRTGSTEWTRLATRAVAPPQAKQVRVLLYADVDTGGPATAWFDDLILRRIQKGK